MSLYDAALAFVVGMCIGGLFCLAVILFTKAEGGDKE